MRILQINKYNYKRGGADAVYFNTSKLFSDNGHEVFHFAMEFEDNLPSEEAEYFPINNDFTSQNAFSKIINSPSFFYNKDAERKLQKLINDKRPDIAHLHNFYGSLTSSVLKVLKNNNIPALVSIHDYKFICTSYLMLDGDNKICERCKGKNHFKAIGQKCVKDSFMFSSFFAMESYYHDIFFPISKMFNKILFVSKFARDIHLTFRPELKNISEQLYNFDPAIITKSPISEKGEYFLYAGRLSKEKGLYTLIEVFNKLPKLRLKIVGTGPEAEVLQSIGMPNIEFLGFKVGDELESVIQNASFVIVPSEWYENNPMAIIEAYSLGKPVIGSRIGGIPEIIIDEETGFLFTANDANDLHDKVIKAASISDDEYASFSMRARSFAQDNFHPQKHYEQLLEIYSKTILENNQISK